MDPDIYHGFLWIGITASIYNIAAIFNRKAPSHARITAIMAASFTPLTAALFTLNIIPQDLIHGEASHTAVVLGFYSLCVNFVGASYHGFWMIIRDKAPE